ADTAITVQDTMVQINVLATDSFEGTPAITAIDGLAITEGGPAVAVANGQVALVGGQLEFTPAPGFNGLVDFIYTVTSGGVTESANVQVTVGASSPPVNTLPGAPTVAEDTPLPITGLSVDDVDGNLATTQLTVSNGTLNVTLAGGATISAGGNG